MKEKIITNFCKNDQGKRWYFSLCMSMLVVVVAELAKIMLEAPVDFVLPDIFHSYYDESVACLEFSWNRRVKLGIEYQSMGFGDLPFIKED